MARTSHGRILRFHVDTDNAQWGRVASNATFIMSTQRRLLLLVDSIGAEIWVLREDAKEIARDTKRYDSVPYPGCAVCKAETMSKHFIGCTYKPKTESEIIDHYRRIARRGR